MLGRVLPPMERHGLHVKLGPLCKRYAPLQLPMERDCTRTLYLHGLQHCWSLPRLPPRFGDEGGEAALRVSKQFARLMSTLPDESTLDILAHEIYLKLHKTAPQQCERVEHHWRPTIRCVLFEQRIVRSKLWHKTIMSMALQWNSAHGSSVAMHPPT